MLERIRNGELSQEDVVALVNALPTAEEPKDLLKLVSQENSAAIKQLGGVGQLMLRLIQSPLVRASPII